MMTTEGPGLEAPKENTGIRLARGASRGGKESRAAQRPEAELWTQVSMSGHGNV